MKRKPIDYLVLVAKGIAMGAADVVPGVSGGTVAFITGIYEELIDSIKSIGSRSLLLLFKRGGTLKFLESINAYFLISVVIGIAISFLTLSKLVHYLLIQYPIFVWSFFFGLILASVWFVGKSIRKWNSGTVISLIAGIAAGYFVTILAPAQTTTAPWFIFLTGSIAICAMILPGISGSFILLLMGKYAFMMGAISSLNFTIISIFLGGAIIGLILFSNLLSYLLHRFHALTIALLTGFMLGSLNKVWPWKIATQTFIDSKGLVKPLVEQNVLPGTFLYHTSTKPYTLWAIGFALLGIITVIALERLSVRDKHQSKNAENEHWGG